MCSGQSLSKDLVKLDFIQLPEKKYFQSAQVVRKSFFCKFDFTSVYLGGAYIQIYGSDLQE